MLDLVVGITTYYKRVNEVHEILHDLLTQKTKIHYKVVLVVSSDEFPNGLPKTITRIRSKKLEIKWVKANIKSYKKLIPIIMEYPNTPILTVDDDIHRSPDFIQKLWTKYQEDPSCVTTICANRFGGTNKNGFYYFRNKKSKIPYGIPSLWTKEGSGSGTIYPAGMFLKTPEFFNSEAYMELAPTDDEAWFFCWRVVNGVKVRLVDIGIDWIILRGMMTESAVTHCLDYLNTGHYASHVQAIANRYKIVKDALDVI